MRKELLSVKIEATTLEKLRKLKVHPRQSYSEVIEILIKKCGREI